MVKNCVIDVKGIGSSITKGKKLHTEEHAKRLVAKHPTWMIRFVVPKNVVKDPGPIREAALAMGISVEAVDTS